MSCISEQKDLARLSYEDVVTEVVKANPLYDPHEVRLEAARIFRPRFQEDKRSIEQESKNDVPEYTANRFRIDGKGDIYYPDYGDKTLMGLHESQLRTDPARYSESDHRISRMIQDAFRNGATVVTTSYRREGEDNRDIIRMEYDPATGEGKTYVINTAAGSGGSYRTYDAIRSVAKTISPGLGLSQTHDGLFLLSDAHPAETVRHTHHAHHASPAMEQPLPVRTDDAQPAPAHESIRGQMPTPSVPESAARPQAQYKDDRMPVPGLLGTLGAEVRTTYGMIRDSIAHRQQERNGTPALVSKTDAVDTGARISRKPERRKHQKPFILRRAARKVLGFRKRTPPDSKELYTDTTKMPVEGRKTDVRGSARKNVRTIRRFTGEIALRVRSVSDTVTRGIRKIRESLGGISIRNPQRLLAVRTAAFRQDALAYRERSHRSDIMPPSQPEKNRAPIASVFVRMRRSIFRKTPRKDGGKHPDSHVFSRQPEKTASDAGRMMAQAETQWIMLTRLASLYLLRNPKERIAHAGKPHNHASLGNELHANTYEPIPEPEEANLQHALVGFAYAFMVHLMSTDVFPADAAQTDGLSQGADVSPVRAEEQDEGSSWVLAAIIWYLVMLREQGMGNSNGHKAAKTKKGQSRKLKRTGVIYAHTSVVQWEQ